MARTTAQLDGAALVLPADDASLIPLDTPVWSAWLEHATTHFRVYRPQGAACPRGEYYCA